MSKHKSKQQIKHEKLIHKQATLFADRRMQAYLEQNQNKDQNTRLSSSESEDSGYSSDDSTKFFTQGAAIMQPYNPTPPDADYLADQSVAKDDQEKLEFFQMRYPEITRPNKPGPSTLAEFMAIEDADPQPRSACKRPRRSEPTSGLSSEEENGLLAIGLQRELNAQRIRKPALKLTMNSFGKATQGYDFKDTNQITPHKHKHKHKHKKHKKS